MKKILLALAIAISFPNIAHARSDMFVGRCVNNSRIISGNDAFPFECQNLFVRNSGKYDVILSYKTYNSVVEFTVHTPHRIQLNGEDILTGDVTNLKINMRNFKINKGNGQCFFNLITSSCVATASDKTKTHAAIFFRPDLK